MTIALRDALVRLARDAAARQLHSLAAVYAEAVRREIHERNGWDYTPLYSNAPPPPVDNSISKGG